MNNLKDAPIHSCACVDIDYALEKKVKKYKTTIEKYCLNVPIGEIKTLLCKSCYSFFQKYKTPNFLFSTNIKLNDPMDFVKNLNELEEGEPFLGWYH